VRDPIFQDFQGTSGLEEEEKGEEEEEEKEEEEAAVASKAREASSPANVKTEIARRQTETTGGTPCESFRYQNGSPASPKMSLDGRRGGDSSPYARRCCRSLK